VLFYAVGATRRPTNRRVPVGWWTMAHRKGRSAVSARRGRGGRRATWPVVERPCLGAWGGPHQPGGCLC